MAAKPLCSIPLTGLIVRSEEGLFQELQLENLKKTGNTSSQNKYR